MELDLATKPPKLQFEEKGIRFGPLSSSVEENETGIGKPELNPW